MVGCPISISLGYLKGVLPDGVAAAWVAAIVRQAAQLYIRRLSHLATQQEREEEDEGGVADALSASDPGMIQWQHRRRHPETGSMFNSH